MRVFEGQENLQNPSPLEGEGWQALAKTMMSELRCAWVRGWRFQFSSAHSHPPHPASTTIALSRNQVSASFSLEGEKEGHTLPRKPIRWGELCHDAK